MSIEQSADLEDEITYYLTGTSDEGSFYMDGKLKATVEINGLSLACTATAPINIKNGKRIKIKIEGDNTLKDASSSDGKGALMVNGHSEIEGSGTLNIYGYAKHAYWADEYILMKKSMTGTINILYAENDGINVNQYFEQNGGTLNISGTKGDGIQVSADDEETGYATISGGTLVASVTASGSKGLKTEGDITINDEKSTPYITITNSGAAYWDTADKEVKGTSCISADNDMTIDAGVISLRATGTGGKGIKADNVFTMNEGDLTITTTGGKYTYNSSNTSSPKGIRAGTKAAGNYGTPTGDLQINGGTINVECSSASDGTEGIESKNTLYINGGDITVTAYDDAVNSAKNMYIAGGTVNVLSSTNDGLDSNANMYFTGGTVTAFGGDAPECSIDAAEGYNLYFNGGTIFGIGGSSVSPSSSSSMAYVSTTATVTGGETVSLKSGNTVICSFTVPDGYTMGSTGGTNNPGGRAGNMGGPGGSSGGWPGNSPGGGNTGGMGNGGGQMLISCPSLTSGSS